MGDCEAVGGGADNLGGPERGRGDLSASVPDA